MHYTIRSGDTLSRIAAAHGTSLQVLLDANPQYRDRPGVIRVGDIILIPSGAAATPGPASSAARWRSWWPSHRTVPGAPRSLDGGCGVLEPVVTPEDLLAHSHARHPAHPAR